MNVFYSLDVTIFPSLAKFQEGCFLKRPGHERSVIKTILKCKNRRHLSIGLREIAFSEFSNLVLAISVRFTCDFDLELYMILLPFPFHLKHPVLELQ